MSKPTVTVLSGLPASGKSTHARSMDALRVNLDDLRIMMGWTSPDSWSKEKEDVAIQTMMAMIEAAVDNKKDVVVDNTHLTARLPNIIRRRVGGRANFDVVYFHCPVEEAIKRDAEREKSVGEQAIRKMAKTASRWMLTEEFMRVWPDVVPHKHETGLPEAIIVDLDGTLARHEGIRDPYDAERCDEDELSTVVEAVLFGYALTMHQAAWDYKVIFLSGRKATPSVKAKTEQWLSNKLALASDDADYYVGIKHELYMREDGDSRPDFVVKHELFQENIAGKYNILFAIDDRKSIIRLWEEMGIETLAVSSLAKEF